MMKKRSIASVSALISIAAFAFVLVLPQAARADFPLPKEIQDNTEVISTFDARQVATLTERSIFAEEHQVCANLIGNALKPVGSGGVFEGKILQVKKPFSIFRVYTKKADPVTKRNNRFGSWWTHVPPGVGTTKADYRRQYEICERFNPDLDHVVECRVYPGALILIGPGQSVDELTCGKPGESYPADTGKNSLQIYIYEMYRHQFRIADEQAQLQNIEQFVGCPPEIADRSFGWYAGKTVLPQ